MKNISQVLATSRNNRSQNVLVRRSQQSARLWLQTPEVLNNLAGMNQRQRRVYSTIYLAILYVEVKTSQ